MQSEPEQRVVRLRTDFKSGALFSCPECRTASCPEHVTVEKE